MRYGVCCSRDNAPKAVSAGFDYVELPAHPLALGERYPEVPVEACNLFFPGGLSLWTQMEEARDHAIKVIEGADECGIGVLVVGSGAARRSLPDGDPAEAEARFVELCDWMQTIADRHDITIAPESLNKSETDVGNDHRLLSLALKAKACGNTADSYHILLEAPAGPLDWPTLMPVSPDHVHLSDRSRTLGATDDPELIGFLRRLKDVGYRGRLSFEGNWSGTMADLLERMKALVATAGI